MCSTCCALGVVGEYRDHQIFIAPGVVSRPFRRLGRKKKIILK